MADVRALLAAERQARRISHPHLSYSKSGMLICTVCNLNVKSEALWEGHLKSANHRRNAAQAAAQENATANVVTNAGKGVKRKIEDVDDDASEERDEADLDARKKPKSRPESVAVVEGGELGEPGSIQTRALPAQGEGAGWKVEQPTPPAPAADNAPPPSNGSSQPPTVDEDEWAAFEREVAPLAAATPNYSSATITAAPLTTAQLKTQKDEDRRRKLETEAEDEKEDEERRIEEEFDLMEEMEERIRRLREKRDALRSGVTTGRDTGKGVNAIAADTAGQDAAESRVDRPDDEGEEDEEEEDEWYS
ncbi:uncharacterized protein Z519_03025 [Cladophialophora bantiana CBS 173.52]|uniref:Zinc finger double-stranded RNA binding domain-containing protein n=1 Tax=Cladophialophora bantiana (strain ATCC 10958 / CBS 173.52 / CDC B-1940 / NIH 8579) TaxID=1442370 RepID=A0A0D2IGU6_CLAB1|nr:uncharacterized protein Z519_03025 [Cladophialophora bantiana CBS 173.52]KIW95959.1 hypothetical protein Z519_03025 [Cladophialophora bantiana CBS 173.52]